MFTHSELTTCSSPRRSRRPSWLGRMILCALSIASPATASADTNPPNKPSPPTTSPVRLNSIGFLPAAAKSATIAGGVPGQTFVVRTVNGNEAFRGKLVQRDPQLCIADFSTLNSSRNLLTSNRRRANFANL